MVLINRYIYSDIFVEEETIATAWMLINVWENCVAINRWGYVRNKANECIYWIQVQQKSTFSI